MKVSVSPTFIQHITDIALHHTLVRTEYACSIDRDYHVTAMLEVDDKFIEIIMWWDIVRNIKSSLQASAHQQRDSSTSEML
jgi:hypothetical protein